MIDRDQQYYLLNYNIIFEHNMAYAIIENFINNMFI
jgi:hypothetical protein